MLGMQISPKAEVLVLDSGDESFKARIALVLMAEHSIDIANHYWLDDTLTALLAKALLIAADKGVRVRLLLPNNQYSVENALLLHLSLHKNIFIRLSDNSMS